MKHLTETALTAIQELLINNQTNTSEQKQLSVKVASTSVSLQSDPEGKKKLSDILGFCFDTLKIYGKEPEQLVSVNKMFQFTLEEYPIDKISAAFKYYFRHNTEMPTPADIINIIQRGNKPPFDKAVYTALSKKKDYQRSFAEDDYVREYEKFFVCGETEL